MARARAVREGLGSWWALTLGEKVELAHVVLLAMAAEIAVKLFSLPRLASLLGIELVNGDRVGRQDAREAVRMDRATVEKRARMVDRVYRHWPRKGSCLRRAVVLGYRIRRASPTLLFGVAREGSDIRAHAWIEIDGKAVGDDFGDWAPLRSNESAG
jgi:Transglutaminase-like superfamily